MKKYFFLLFILLGSQSGFSQDKTLFGKHELISKGDTLPYRLLLPVNYDANKKYPLIIFMHGSGERGNDNESQLTHGAALFLRDSIREKYPAIVVFPQCSANSYWSNVDISKDSTGRRSFIFQAGGKPTVAMRLTDKLLHQLIKKYPVNKSQVYIGGLSMGGMGTFELVKRNPKTFAAAFPICGGANIATAPKLIKPNWWIFHGAKDDVVPPENSIVMADALKAAGAHVKLTIYPEANHNSWDSAFAEKDLMFWLFSQLAN